MRSDDDEAIVPFKLTQAKGNGTTNRRGAEGSPLRLIGLKHFMRKKALPSSDGGM